MKNSFVNKVAAERAVLDVVNSYTSGTRQLTGLSWIAIDAWQKNIETMTDQKIVVELKEISDLCQSLSDRSHETFTKLDPDIGLLIASRIQLLSQLMKGVNFGAVSHC